MMTTNETHEGHDVWPLISEPGRIWCRTCQDHYFGETTPCDQCGAPMVEPFTSDDDTGLGFCEECSRNSTG